MRRVGRAVAGCAISALAFALLVGCTPAHYGGVRLNLDGTVDFAVCDREIGDIDVAFYTDDNEAEPVASWSAARNSDVPADPITFEYGVAPVGFSNAFPARVPPASWIAVGTPAGYFDRDDLLPEEWVWNTPKPFDWIPARPCDDFFVGPDGELRWR